MGIETINPTTEMSIHQYTEMSDNEIDHIITSTQAAFIQWRKLSIHERSIPMSSLANLLRKRKNEYATLIATEMGKPITQGEAEILKCATVCEYYIKNAADYLKPKIIQTEMSTSYVTYQPLGIIFGIMPWNFPFWQVFRFAIPTIMAGNGVLLKHAPISTGTALVIEKLFKEAGFVENIFRALIISNETAEKVISHPTVTAVTLTGSRGAGKIVGAEAAKVLKKSVLELGGSDPYIILEDADLEEATEACVTSRMSNSGQVCIAAKRLIVVGSIHEKVIQLLQEKLKRYKMGNPLDSTTNFGPLARKDIRDKVHEQVQDSIKKGAQLKMGGNLPPQPGFYYPPTLLINVKKGMPAYDDEIFGPVIAVINASDETEAIAIANDTVYGLGAALFTKDIKRAEKIATEQIQAGTCAINTIVSSDARLPFGGIKGSGYGRELSEEGIHSFVNIKTINIK